MKLNNRGSWTLIGLVVVAAIIMVWAVYYYVGSGGTATVKSDSKLLTTKSSKKTTVGKAIDTGKAEVCRQQLNQIRLGIQTYKTAGDVEGNPASLKDLDLGVSSSYFQCPVTNDLYSYDPASGQVSCPIHATF